jgi:hypothetical protein
MRSHAFHGTRYRCVYVLKAVDIFLICVAQRPDLGTKPDYRFWEAISASK